MTTAAERIATLEFERKFLVPTGRGEAARHCLEAYCRPDEDHAESVVASIYFDTPGFRLLHEKIDGQLYKTKIRLRWYEDPHTGPTESVSWLEVKSRVGSRRAKWRRQIELSAAELAESTLADAAIRAVPALLDSDVTVSARGLTPVLVVRYLRSRYRDPLSGTRIALDRRIQVTRVSTARLAWRGPIELPTTVLEIKGSTFEPPARLTFLRALAVEATSYSKYHAGFEAVVSSTAIAT